MWLGAVRLWYPTPSTLAIVPGAPWQVLLSAWARVLGSLCVTFCLGLRSHAERASVRL